MIDVAEYTRFLEIEARLHGRPAVRHSADPMYYTLNPEQFPPKKYDYFLHPRFGVVYALDDEGKLIDKTPVCEALDRELFDL